MESIHFYPVLSEELLSNSGCHPSSYSFGYKIDDHYIPLKAIGKNVIRLDDSLESWKIDNDGLKLSRHVLFEYPDFLYGENGIAPKNAELGICIIWVNKTLSQMGYILPCSEKKDQGRIEYDFNYEFEPGEIKGDLVLDTTVYIKKAANEIDEKEQHMANIEGVSVGIIDSLCLDFDSLYMEFPIREVNEKNKPLWWIEFYQWEDPTRDPFSEDTVCLYLNSFYDYCPKGGDIVKNPEILIEILSTAYLMIFEKIREMGDLYFNRTIDGVDLEPGSISMVMHYFYSGCDPSLKTESIDLFQKTIRSNIEKIIRRAE